MALVDRLSGQSGNKIQVHTFYSALVEMWKGEVSQASIEQHFSLDASDISDLNWLIGKFNASVDKREFADRIHGIFILAESQYPGYTLNSDLVAVVNRIG